MEKQVSDNTLLTYFMRSFIDKDDDASRDPQRSNVDISKFHMIAVIVLERLSFAPTEYKDIVIHQVHDHGETTNRNSP